MATKKIALDAGHGLKTAGKQTPDGIKEWTLNDKVRDKVVEMLKDYDVEFVFPDNNEGNVDEGLTARKKMYIASGVDAAVSIHHNAYTGSWGKATGVEVFTDKNETSKDRQLAEAIYSRLVKYTGLKGRGIKEENWTVINQNQIPAVLVEGGFMDSTIDHPVITSDAGQTAYAKAVAEGLIEFLGLTKKVVVSAPTYTKKQFIKDVQAATGAKVDGIAGNETLSKTVTVSKSKNNRHAVVKAVQKYLNVLGYNCGTADGIAGSKFDAAVKAFQKANGCVVDGEVTAKGKTWKKLLGLA